MLKIGAKIISIIFHPLYIVLYGFGLLRLVNPYQFSGFSNQDTFVFFVSLVMLSCIIPMISILMMYFLGMIDGLEMEKSTDRIGPLIVTGVCYCWLFINFYKSSYVPLFFTSFMLGATIALFLAFVINLFHKISLHTVGMGGLIMGSCILIFGHGYGYVDIQTTEQIFHINLILVLAIIFLIAGLVGTSRLVLKAHIPIEVYGGYLVGCIAQIIALRIIY